MDVFRISGDGVSLEARGVRPSHDQFVQLIEVELLEKRIKELELSLGSVMAEIFRLRAMMDSYDAPDEVAAEVFLTLNKLCWT